MKVKLITDGNKNYSLLDYNNELVATTMESELTNQKLSLKNCQAIELGYDLDELVYEHFGNPTEEELNNESEFGYALHKSNIFEFKKGFKKALEILGDKKFSENNIDEAFDAGYEMLDSPKNYNDVLKEFKESLEPTEWDVEVVIEVINNGKGEDGLLHETVEPKLDENGCLILKRI
jgi:hypothetical protein